MDWYNCGAKLLMLDIILRTCSRKEAQVHGGDRLHSKEDILLRCLRSLKQSIEVEKKHQIKLTIIDDHSSLEIVKILKDNADVFIPLEWTGNSASLHSVYNYAKSNCPNLIYFVEDDYLHERSAINEMLGFYYKALYNLNKEVALFPMDCNDRYKESSLYPSFIVNGEKRYWRTIKHTTGTNFISINLLVKFFSVFKKFANYDIDPTVDEDSTINKIWGIEEGAICFSPIPTLAYHLQDEKSLPLYSDYRNLWGSLV